MKRLQAIFSLITPCDVFVDVGTDHGLIALQASIYAKKVFATEISQKCLQKAKNNVKVKNVEFLLGDGLNPLNSGELNNSFNTVCICGMGGNTIIDILQNHSNIDTLILQPQSDVPSVRWFLVNSGYNLIFDIVAYERDKYYDVIKAVKCKDIPESLSELMLLFGRFYQNKDINLKNKLLKLKKCYQNFKRTQKNEQYLNLIDKALSYQ